ncbi:MAG: carboxypeptidase regulatory-like domain-containing protein [Magnetococcales bacterium]|nr:carboxypeptidase regulatory-like domain-containing protein [Magnetococcales bacterium]
MVGQRIKQQVLMMAFVLFGLVGAMGMAHAESISGQVGQRAIILVVNGTNAVLQATESSPVPGMMGQWNFSVSDLPVNQDLSVFLFTKGTLLPLRFNNRAKDAFQLLSGAAFNLGLLNIHETDGVVTPTNPPTTGLAVGSATALRSTVPFGSIQRTLMDRYATLDVPSLVDYGMSLAFGHGWMVAADAFFAKADEKATAAGDARKHATHVLHAISRIAALATNTAQSSSAGTTTYATAGATLGDLLAGFGCTRRHLGLEKMECPKTLPIASPTGQDLSGWLNAAMIPAFNDSLALLNELPTDMASFKVGDPGSQEPDETEIDYSDVLMFKGLLGMMLGQLYIDQAYDWNIDIDAAMGVNTEQLFLNNPNFGSLSPYASTNLAAAKSHWNMAADALLAAIPSIQAESDPQDDDLFTLEAREVADATKVLNDFKAALAGTAQITEGTRSMALNLAKWFDGVSLRGILPSFSGNKPSGLFPDATLGGVFPDGVYNFRHESLNQDVNQNGIPDILEDMVFVVPQATITVDGAPTDWGTLAPMLVDALGDQGDGFSGLDVTGIYLARDASQAYLRIDRASLQLPTGEYVNYWVNFMPVQAGGPAFSVELFQDATGVYARLYNTAANPRDYNAYVKLSDTLTVNTTTQTMEVAWPLSLIDPGATYELGFFTHHTVGLIWPQGGSNGDWSNNRPARVRFSPNAAQPVPLTVYPPALNRVVGGSGDLVVSGGVAPYRFDAGSALITVVGNNATATVTCAAEGGSTVLVQDNAAHSFSVPVTCTASSGGGGGTTTTIPMEPINMTVGGGRTLPLPTGSGTPTVTVTSGSDVITWNTSVTGVPITCQKAGSATLTVAFGTNQATTTVTCVDPATPVTSIDMTQWLFPANLTLVTHGRWQSSQPSNPMTEFSIQPSRAGGSATLMDRTVSVEQSTHGENYYTLDSNGLTFHGEKRVEPGQNRTTRFIDFGFKTQPDPVAGITAADLATSNFTVPSPLVPATVTNGYTHSQFSIRFPLDEDGKVKIDQWTITKSEITVTGNVNLLDSVPPTDLMNDEYFAHWRDSITDADLLSKVTHAAHIRMVETRYQPQGGAASSSQVNHVYLAQGLGVVFEHNQENDGMWKGSLRATVDAAGVLKSLTTDQVKARKVRIDGPAGVILKDAFVQTRAEHTSSAYASPHSHNATATFNETPGTSSALLTVFNRLNAPVGDEVTSLNVTFGAAGFVRKNLQVETASLTDPQVLTLSAADQGRNVSFRVVTASNTPVADAGIQILPFENGACVSGQGQYFGTDQEGKIAAVLADGTYCLGVWPNNGAGSFTGGWYKADAAAGTVNVQSGNLTTAAAFQVSPTSGELVLVVGGAGSSTGKKRITGILTDGTHGLVNADLIVYPANSQTPLVFHTTANGAFDVELDAGSYSFAFKYVGTGFVAMAYVASIGETTGLSRTQGMSQNLQNDLNLGTVSLTSAYNQTSGGGGDPGTTTKITVSGSVSGGQGALPNILVEFQPDWEHNTGVVDAASVKTDGAGHYSVDIYPGKYRVQFRSEYWDNATMSMVKVPGVLGQGGYADDKGGTVERSEDAKVFDFAQATTLNATMVSGMRISGKVVNANQQPVQGVRVELQPDWESTTGTSEWAQGTTDANGNYEIFVKKGSVYRVYFSTSYYDWQTQKQVKLDGLGGYSTGAADNKLNGASDTAKKYTFTADTTVNATLIAGLTIRGTVTTDGTTGIQDVTVRLQPEWDEETGSSGLWSETRTSATGQYEFSVQPGKYRIEFATSYWKWDTNPPQEVKLPGGLVGGYADGDGKVVHDWSSAKIFRVTGPLVVDARMVTGMTLSGKVVQANGTALAPVTGAEVSVHDKDWDTNFHARTDAEGNFSVLVVPNKEYRVEVWPSYCETGTGTGGSGQSSCNAVNFQGGSWITPPEASWVSRWVKDDSKTRPLVKASLVSTTDILTHNGISGQVAGVVPGMVMSQWEDHAVTNILMDKSLSIGVQVDAGKPIHGRVVNGANEGVPYAWVNTPLGGVATDQGGYFTLNLPSVNLTQGVNNTFDINISPSGHQDPQTGAWIEGTGFIGGAVVGNATDGYTVSSDGQQALAFEKDLTADATGEVAWPLMDLGNGTQGLLVRVGSGLSITGTIQDGSGNGIANLWVNAWSHDTRQGAGKASDSTGQYSLLIHKPAAGKVVWYEVNVWSESYLSPDPVLVKVEPQGVTGVYKRAKDKFVEAEDGYAKPVAGEVIQENPAGGVVVNFTLSTGNTISGRVTDGSNNGLAWTWVDIHSQDGSRWYGANTDENGNYRVTVAPANNYVGVVWGWSGLYRTTYYKNAGKEDEATLIDASGSKSPENVDFLMNAGAKISGTIAGLGKDTKVRVNVWSESERVWGGTEVVGTGSGAVSFEVSGLAQAGDYRLDWQSDVEDVPSGYYGGVAGGGASGPKSWEKATLLSTLNGNVTGVAVDLAAVTSKTLKVKVTGLVAGAKVDANVWSEELSAGRWKQGTADSTGQALIELKGLDASGKDYRLFVGGPDGGFKTGNFKGEVGASDYPATLGSLVGWDRATLLDMSSDHYVSMQVGSGRKVTVKVSGLKSGQKAWVDAFSETTWSWGGGEVSYGNGTSDQVEIKGLEAAEDYRISIWGGQIQGGTYAGNGKAPGAWESAELVNVTSGDATIDLVVSSGKSIAGTVNGMKKAQWGWVDAWSNSTYSWGGNAVQAAGSGADAYTIAGVGSATDFKVTFSADGYMTQKKSDVNTSGGDVTGVDFTASTGGSIAGTITGLKAQEWVRVDVWSPATDAFVVGGATADANGSAAYTLSGVPDGTDYVVGVWRGYQGVFYATGGVTPVWDNHSKVSVVNAGATKGIDFNLTAAGNLFYTLSGTVSGLAADQVVEINAWSSTGGSRTSVTGNANYTLEGLPAGNYTVEVSSSGYVSQRTKSVTVSDNKVTASSWTSGWNDVGTVSINGNTTGLNVAMLTGYAIKGTVTSGGNAVSGAWVNAWSSGNSMGGGAVTNTKGEFTIKGLSNATYKVDVWTLEGTAGTDVTVNGANQTGVTLTVVKAAGIVQGTVTSGGSAAGGAMVIAYDASGVEKDRAVANGTTGVYKLEGLEPNQSYTVKAFSATKVKNADWSVTSGYATGSVTATSAGATLDLSLNVTN